MYLVFDIGGTKTRIAYSPDGASWEEPVKFATPERFEEGVELILSHAHALTEGKRLIAAGGGVAGPLSTKKSALVNSPNLPDWIDKPLQERLAAGLGVPVFLENDSAIVALGEAHKGAGKGYGIVAYLTVSTGVGGARIVDGNIDRNAYGFEPGHQVIDMDGTLCRVCDVSGEAEALVSGTATALRFGKKAYEVNDPAVWEQLAQWLSYVLTNTIVHWSPNVVVLGGSMIVGDPAISVARTAAHLKKTLTIFPQHPPLVPAILEDVGGLYGALEYLTQHHPGKER